MQFQSFQLKDNFLKQMTSSCCNLDLVGKYKDNVPFRELMDSNQKQYDQKLQESFYSDLSKVNKKFIQISSQFIDEKNLNGSKITSQKKKIVYVFSHFQSQNSSELSKYFLYFIHSFPEPREPYHLIYVNSTSSEKGKCWTNFKSQILQELPLKYLLFLEKLVLIRPSFLDRASSMIQFGVQNKFFYRKIEKYDTLKSYYDSIGKKFDQMKKFLPSEVLQEEPNDSVVKAVFSSFICNFNENRASHHSEIDLHPQISTKIEKQTKQEQSTKIGKQEQSKQKLKKKGLQNYPTGQSGIPLVLQLMIFYFTQIPIRCEKEGLFRKCTSIDDERELMRELEKQNYEILTGIENQIAVGSTIKRFLSNLEPPVIPYQNYERLVENHTLDSIIREIHSFPIINFMTLMHLMKFLRESIIPNSKKNLMTAENVAICFAPCLMRSKQVTVKQILLATISVEITKMMLLNFQEIFGDSQKQKRISRKTYRIFRKNSKINEQSARFNFSPVKQQKNKNGDIEGYTYYECPQDFLKPVASLLDDQKQSSLDKISEKSSQPFDKNQFQRDGQKMYGIKVINVDKHKSEIEINQFKGQEQTGMKKHSSFKKITYPEDKSKEHCRKSDIDPNQIFQEIIENLPNQEGVNRLHKLRANRSKISFK